MAGDTGTENEHEVRSHQPVTVWDQPGWPSLEEMESWRSPVMWPLGDVDETVPEIVGVSVEIVAPLAGFDTETDGAPARAAVAPAPTTAVAAAATSRTRLMPAAP